MLDLFFPKPVGGAGSAALLAVRLVAGTAFVLHGWPKIHNPLDWMGPNATVPALFQALAAVSEFGGGFAWIAGALTPLASAGIFSTMVVAVSFHLSRGDPFMAPGKPSYELALVYLTVALLLALVGPGRFSADAAWWSRQR